MGSDFLGVRLFQSLDRFVVLFEFFQLTFKFLASGVESLFYLGDLSFHVFDFPTVSFFKRLFLLLDLGAVASERFLGLLLFSEVLLLELRDLILPRGTILGLL